jgi:hypothetical protein
MNFHINHVSMSKITKTFYEDDDLINPISWVDEILWKHSNYRANQDPAEVNSTLANKIKITIEVYAETNHFQNNIIDAYDESHN